MPEPAPGRAESMVYTLASDLAAVRAFVSATAAGLGLERARADLLMLAVNELATNTLQYTREGGLVRLWSDAGQVVCDVADQGPLRVFGRPMPPADAARGRGLPIVELACDDVTAFAADGTTVVRMRVSL